MDRRGYVVGCATILSGCVGGGGTPTATPRPPLPDSVERIVTLVEKSDLPPEFPAEATVNVVEPLITTDHTARLHVAVRNTGNTSREYAFNPHPPLHIKKSDAGPGTLILLDESRDYERAPECWQYSGGIGSGWDTVSLAPGEAVQHTLEIWDFNEQTECLLPGEYTFSASYPRLKRQNMDTKWSFALRLERA